MAVKAGNTPPERGRRGQDASDGARRSYDVTCTGCGAKDTVPFRPKPGRKVLCRPCHQANQQDEQARPRFDVACTHCGTQTSVPFKPKPGRDVLCRPCMQDREQKARGPFLVTCSHCGTEDTVPFEPFPDSAVLCRGCLDNPNVERIGGRVLHKVICSVCGDIDKVPFKPDSGSRVLCHTCHSAERDAKRKARERVITTRHPRDEHGTTVRIDIRCDRCGCEDSLPFVPRTSGPILCRQCAEATFGEDWARRHRVGQTRDFPITCARCSRTDFVSFRPSEGRKMLCGRCMDDQAIPNPERLEGRTLAQPYLFIKRRKPEKP